MSITAMLTGVIITAFLVVWTIVGIATSETRGARQFACLFFATLWGLWILMVTLLSKGLIS